MTAFGAYHLHHRRCNVVDFLIHILQECQICCKQAFHMSRSDDFQTFDLCNDLGKDHDGQIGRIAQHTGISSCADFIPGSCQTHFASSVYFAVIIYIAFG